MVNGTIVTFRLKEVNDLVGNLIISSSRLKRVILRTF